ncbi:MAG TPA: hypothetical protein VGV37_02520 [Aliidongia sp.]|uniref:Bbp19 family protein n=1 Tax=Aliidongia sp. TaxID=1914230 RepID=UPI002DDD11CD|nr:hypothetical protein [Aliidongia sp.]HEV2673385.1 hypothetical protein [Aliidongia sp.]
MFSHVPKKLGAWRKRVGLNRAYHETFGSPQGQRVLADILARAKVLSTSHSPGDAHDTAFNEGRRALGLEIVGELRWTEMELLKLAEEKTGHDLSVFDEEVS